MKIFLIMLSFVVLNANPLEDNIDVISKYGCNNCHVKFVKISAEKFFKKVKNGSKNMPSYSYLSDIEIARILSQYQKD